MRRHDHPAARGKVLKRCTRCGKLGAAYLVEDPDEGELLLCHACWGARHGRPAQAENRRPRPKER